MAQLLVHIDSDLKRRLKAHLAANGTTLKVWVTAQALHTLESEDAEAAPRPTPARRRRAKKPPGKAARIERTLTETPLTETPLTEKALTEPATVHPQAGVFRPATEFNVEED